MAAYVIHAVLTGTSLALTNALGIKDGFGFSAGFFDYALNFNIATHPLWLVPIGLRRPLLLPVPVRDPEVEPEDARARGGRGHACRSRHERLSVLLAAVVVVTPARILAPGWVHVDGDRIVDVGSGEPPRAEDVSLPAPRSSPASSTVTCTGRRRVVRRRRTRGRRHRGPRAPGARHDDDDREPGDRAAGGAGRVGAGLADLVDDGLLAGIHLEGPWLSPRYAGAHDPDLLTSPTPPAADALLEAGRGHVRMVTLAPELEGGLDAVRRLTDAGVVAAIGHTDATYDVACAALEAGARVGTHLFNAMRGLHHREPGPIAALLEHPDAYVELYPTVSTCTPPRCGSLPGPSRT